MISLKLKNAEELLPINVGEHYCVVLENKEIFYQYICYLYNGCFGNDTPISFFDESEWIPADKISFFVPSLIDLNINTKKNINALYKILKNKYYPELTDRLEEIKEKASEIVHEISMDFDVDLVSSSSIQADDLFKIMDIRFLEDDESFLELLIKYIKVVSELHSLKIFILFDLELYFEEDQIKTIFKELSYLGINIIDFERNNVFVHHNLWAKTIIIDRDLCEIV